MTWPELIDRHWAPCYALALLALAWMPVIVRCGNPRPLAAKKESEK